MLSPKNSRKINGTVRKLSREAQQTLEANQRNTGANADTVGVDLRFNNDNLTKVVRRIRFGFNRRWVYTEKGARRGHGGEKGSVWVDEKGRRKRTNPNSLGKMNRGAAKAKPWFNPAIQKFTQKLTDHVAKDFANISFDNLKIK